MKWLPGWEGKVGGGLTQPDHDTGPVPGRDTRDDGFMLGGSAQGGWQTLKLLAIGAAVFVVGIGSALAQPPPPPDYAPIPPPRVEVVPPLPGERMVWEPGHWHWDGFRYVWFGGHYVERRVAWHHWVEGRWIWGPREGRWFWRPAHWE